MELQKKKFSQTQHHLNFEKADIEQKDKEATGAKETTEMTRLAYYTLLSAAMKHRDKFYEGEINTFKMLKEGKKKVNKSYWEDLERAEKRLVNFYKLAHAEVKSFCSGNGNASVIGEYMAMVAPEVLLAKDPQEVLMLLRMYNDGNLDVLFEEYRKEKKSIKDENTLDELTTEGNDQVH